MAKLPKDGRSQEIGRLAGRALGNKLPIAWIEKDLDGDSDFGLDYLMQLKSYDNFVSYSFYLQLKGTTQPSYSADKSFISYDFKVKTLCYYLQQEPLVMVAIVDLQNNENTLSECPIYYLWLDEDWFETNKEKLESNDTISIRVPTKKSIEPSLDVYDYYSKRIDRKFALNDLHRAVKTRSSEEV